MGPHMVDVKWLAANLKNVRIFDASLPKPGSGVMYAAFLEKRIPGAHWFDQNKVATTPHKVPHMMPSLNKFAQEMARQNVKPDDHIVCYDQIGIFASPRMWYTFLAMGHKGPVSILDGGLPAWLAECGNDVESGDPLASTVNDELTDEPVCENPGWSFDETRIVSMDEMIGFAKTGNLDRGGNWLFVDARNAGRFDGVDLEPDGRKSGHIPHVNNVPWTAVVDPKTGLARSDEVVAEKLASVGFKKDGGLQLGGTCGSALSACIVLWSAVRAGVTDFEHMSLFDHSWKGWDNEGELCVRKE